MNAHTDTSNPQQDKASESVVDLTYADASGVRKGRFPIAVWIGVATPFVAISLFAPLLTSSNCCLPLKTVCAGNLRGIGQAMYIYAMDEPDGMFPDDLQKVVDANNASHKQFICPEAPAGRRCYFYAPGASLKSDPDVVLMYEDPRNHNGEGGNVLFQDGHVVFIKFPEYQEIVDSSGGVVVSVTAATGGE
ncbi:MAG TPA: hypothetical protein P5081_14395 [Phycisphaerae bacterium]|nr:hypothetical protein [Phycisphaerae bacterium]HRW54060.1 hypothetical protein [Phycisphaerae bacterium]